MHCVNPCLIKSSPLSNILISFCTFQWESASAPGSCDNFFMISTLFFLTLIPCLHWISCTFFNQWVCVFFLFTLISTYLALSIRGLCLLYRALGIKSDSLWDWMCVAMARCIWEAIHSAGTLWFNLKRDWCWQTPHPLSSKCFLRCPTSIADGQRALFVMVISRLSAKTTQ